MLRLRQPRQCGSGGEARPWQEGKEGVALAAKRDVSYIFTYDRGKAVVALASLARQL